MVMTVMVIVEFLLERRFYDLRGGSAGGGARGTTVNWIILMNVEASIYVPLAGHCGDSTVFLTMKLGREIATVMLMLMEMEIAMMVMVVVILVFTMLVMVMAMLLVIFLVTVLVVVLFVVCLARR